jgi:hypothetical protein
VSPGWPNGGTHLGVTPQGSLFGVRRTRGTETSQYPEEEKSIEITRVAASETVRCLNRGLRAPGLEDPRTVRAKPCEVPWNGAPKTVTAR